LKLITLKKYTFKFNLKVFLKFNLKVFLKFNLKVIFLNLMKLINIFRKKYQTIPFIEEEDISSEIPPENSHNLVIYTQVDIAILRDLGPTFEFKVLDKKGCLLEISKFKKCCIVSYSLGKREIISLFRKKEIKYDVIVSTDDNKDMVIPYLNLQDAHRLYSFIETCLRRE